PIVGECRKAEQPCPFAPQGHHLRDQGPVVCCSTVLTAPDPRVERPFTQIPPGRELQEAFDRRARKGDRVFARLATLFGVGAGRRTGEVRQPGEVALIQDHGEGLLVGQYILRELGAEARKSLIDGAKTILSRLLKCATGADKSGVVALQNAGLLGTEAQRVASAIERGYAGIECRIEVERIVMAGEGRREVPRYLFVVCRVVRA